MEILKRAKGFQDGEIVAWNENHKNVREEVLKRNKKAGYIETNRENISAGWTRKYEENFKLLKGK